SYSVIANVTAEYEMTNPTTEKHFVQMAFPYIEKLNNTNYDDIKITSDGKELPYELYIGKSLNSYGSNSEENIEEKFNFDEIVNSLSNDMYVAKNFTADEIGKLYYFEIEPTTNEGINFTVDFTYDQGKTKIFVKN